MFREVYKKMANLLWDLGNTLLKIDAFSIARRLGLIDMLLYPVLDFKHPKQAYEQLFRVLNTIKVNGKEPCQATAQGKPLPPIVCKWLAGELTPEQIDEYLKTPLIERMPEGFFNSKREARLAESLLRTLTNPKAIGSSLKIINEGIDLLKECAEQYDKQGKQRHALFILSNWDPYSFDYVLNQMHLKKLFEYFHKSNLIISGDIGHVKPHASIYEYVLETYNLNPADTILIDDQEENIKGAQEHGMKGILLNNGNYDEVREKLIEYGILK
jgi:FMN phosphatase YigB (HAD superfamily)